MTGVTTQANETLVPVMPCVSVEATLEFYQALGFEVTHKQTKPYLYLALKWSGFELHFVKAPQGMDPVHEEGGVCLVLVDAVAAYHSAFVQSMRKTYGKILAAGRPRITRYRPGASRFSVVDPSGNSIIFIQRDEPDLDYGGSKELEGLARALDNARIFREFKNDDRAAFRALTSGLRRHAAQAPAAERALALATLIDLAPALNEHDKIEAWTEELGAIQLTEAEKRHIEDELRDARDM